MKTEVHEHFTDTIFYQIELTAKYCRLLGQQVFEKFNLGISLEEYYVLDLLTFNESLCQRDIAKIILKDRANTGKLLDMLASKQYITRELTVKNNRPVKLVKITEEGIRAPRKILRKSAPIRNSLLSAGTSRELSFFFG